MFAGKMKKAPLKFVAGLLLGIALLAGGFGFWNFIWFRLSLKHAPAQLVHLEEPGETSFRVDPPGRSCFRPGGKIEIFLFQNGKPWESEKEQLVKGKATIQVRNCHNAVCMESELTQGLSRFITREGAQRFLSPDAHLGEFDVSGGGPYTITLTVLEPFDELSGLEQRLIARHFVCGSEAILHWASFGVSGIAMFVALITLLKLRRLGMVARNARTGFPKA